jgi:hypothetical protein
MIVREGILDRPDAIAGGPPCKVKAPPKESWKDKLGIMVNRGGRKSHLASLWPPARR